MTWRTIYISKQCCLSFKNNFLVVRNEDVNMIHLSEIHTILIDSTMTTISTYLINKAIEYKIKIVFCDEQHNPSCEINPYYGAFDTARKLEKSSAWMKDSCDLLWKEIVKYKIKYQSRLLEKNGISTYSQLLDYMEHVETNDITNREGHAAKVYFNSLFGNSFSRDQDNCINAALNYGYSIILSAINREIVNNGYVTQIGIHHRGPTNPFNLGCDLMEIFRPMVDDYVYLHENDEFTIEYKKELVNLLNSKFIYYGKSMYFNQILSIFIKKCLDNLHDGIIESEIFEYYEE